MVHHGTASCLYVGKHTLGDDLSPHVRVGARPLHVTDDDEGARTLRPLLGGRAEAVGVGGQGAGAGPVPVGGVGEEAGELDLVDIGREDAGEQAALGGLAERSRGAPLHDGLVSFAGLPQHPDGRRRGVLKVGGDPELLGLSGQDEEEQGEHADLGVWGSTIVDRSGPVRITCTLPRGRSVPLRARGTSTPRGRRAWRASSRRR